MNESRLNRHLRTYLLFLLAVIFVLNVMYTVRKPIWNPRNELAHYDHIDRFSSGRVPRLNDDISDYSYEVTLEHFSWNTPEGFDGSRASMGIEGKSYEAHQPFLYYSLLAPPNALLKYLAVSPPTQITILRVIQLLFVQAGILLLIPIFKEIHRIAGVKSIYGYLMALGMAFSNIGSYHSLGNDNLSLLICNAAVYFCLVSWRRGAFAWRILAGLTAGAAFLVKYTNGLILIIHVILWALLFVGRKESRERRNILPFSLPFLMIAAYLLINQLLYSDTLRTSVTESYFGSVMLPTPGVVRFLKGMIVNSFSLIHLGIITPGSVMWIVLFMVVLNTVVCGWRSFVGKGAYDLLVFVAGIMACLVILSATLLNEFRPGVRWGAFRHYYGFQLFYLAAIFNVPVRMGRKVGAGLVVVLAGLFSVLAVRYGLQLM